MKFKDLFLYTEQEDDDPQIIDEPVDDFGNPFERDDEDPEHDLTIDYGDGRDLVQAFGEPQKPKAPKKLSQTQQAKKAWMEESPGLTEFQVMDAVAFFNQRKPLLRAYQPFCQQQQGIHHVNLPEITSLSQRFPQMKPALSSLSTIRDIRNYSWEVMEFYMHLVRTASAIIDENNLIPNTKLSWKDQFDLAKEKWDEPRNQIYNEGGLIVYKIVSKHESVKYGSIQRILKLWRADSKVPELQDKGPDYWCTAVPASQKGRSNLWTNYRPERAFYYVWDKNQESPQVDRLPDTYCGAIFNTDNNGYGFVDLYNGTVTGKDWSYIAQKYPQLAEKENLFPYFGTTTQEVTELKIDDISMISTHRNYFGALAQTDQEAYIEAEGGGKHVNNRDAFLTMEFPNRKLYVDKTSLENNDIANRFLCDDPNNPFGILDILTKEHKLDKYLDKKILKTNLGIEEGILAIKKLIIGTNWERYLSDNNVEQEDGSVKGYTLIRLRDDGNRQNALERRYAPYGVMDTGTGDLIKNPHYVQQAGEAYLKPFNNEDGSVNKGFNMSKFLYRLGDGNYDQNEGFYMFTTQSATVKNRDGSISDDYLEGKYFTLSGGDEFIRNKLATGEYVKLPS